METAIIRTISAVFLTTRLLAFPGQANGDVASSEQGKPFTGTVVKVEDKDRAVTVKGFWFWSTKTFNVGDTCKILIGDNQKEAKLKDLAPGNWVIVNYSSVGGVNVASQIAEKYRHFTGHIAAIDLTGKKLTVKRGTNEKSFSLADDYNVLVNDKTGRMSDLKIGHKVTVAYDSLGEAKFAHQIALNSLSFVGTVEAIDAEARTLKAEHLMTERKFHMADDCLIVSNGELNGKLSDLRIGDTVVFNYQNVDGVLVANRVAVEMPQGNKGPGQSARNNVTQGAVAGTP